MSDSLAPEEIEALFAQAARGAMPEQVPADNRSGGRRTRWLRTVDFTRPTKFSTEQERRLRRMLDAFCTQASQRVLAEHRLPMELEVIDVQQLTYANAFRLLPETSVHATLSTAPHEARLLLSSELALICTALESLLGGDARGPVAERELTDIDRRLTHRLLRTMTEALSTLWFEQVAVTIELKEVHASAETVQVAANSEPTLALIIEARMHRVTNTLALLVPYAAIAPVAGAFARPDETLAGEDPTAKVAAREGVQHVPITVRTEVASTLLALDDILALAPGDVLKLDGNAAGPVSVLADQTPIFNGFAGRSGTRRAVQVLGPAEVAP